MVHDTSCRVYLMNAGPTSNVYLFILIFGSFHKSRLGHGAIFMKLLVSDTNRPQQIGPQHTKALKSIPGGSNAKVTSSRK